MKNKKLYVTLELEVLRLEESCIRTSGEPDAPTATLITGGGIQWQDGWGN